MRCAFNEALKAWGKGEIPIGAVAIADDKLVARAHNAVETNHDPTAHAEMQLIRELSKKKGDWRLTDVTLYVTKEPCPMCAGALIMAKISRVVYGLPDAKTGAVESIFNIPGHPALHQNIEVTAGIMEDECHEILMRFFKKRR